MPAEPRRRDVFKSSVVSVMAVVTVITAATTWLQVEANGRASLASRASQLHAISAMETRLAALQAWTYDVYVLQNVYGLSSEIGLTGDADRDARVAALRTLTAHSGTLTQPPYTPATNGSAPVDLARYLAEGEVEPTYWQQQRESAALLAGAWGSKAALYVTLLSFLAVALFLFGLALTVGGYLRFGFAGLGLLVTALTSLVIGVTAITPPRARPEPALRALADGVADVTHAELLFNWGLAEEAVPFVHKSVTHLSEAIRLDPRYAFAYSQRGHAWLAYGLNQYLAGEDRTEALADAQADYVQAVALGDDSLLTFWNLGFANYLLGDYTAALEWTDRAIASAPQQIALYVNRGLVLFGLGREAEGFAAIDEAFDRAAAQEVSSSRFYLRGIIHNVTQLVANHPDPTLERALVHIKERYVALAYRGGQPVEATGAQVSGLRFGSALAPGGAVTGLGSRFAPGTETVFVLLEGAEIPDLRQVALVVYVDDYLDETLTVVRAANFEPGQPAWLPLEAPFVKAGGLRAGHYRVDLHIEAELIASGEFDIGP